MSHPDTAANRQCTRVLMIGPYPREPDRINGGVASALMYLSNALAIRNDVELIGVRIAKDVRDTCASSRYSWTMEDLPLGRFSLSTLYRRQLARLEQIIRHYRPDIVHAHGTDIAGFLAVQVGVPAVVTVHGLLGECARFQTRIPARIRAALAAAVTERQTVRSASDLIAISPFVTQYYGTEIRGRIHCIPNAIASEYFEIQRHVEPGRLLYAGRIANGKGLVELLSATATLRDERVNLVLAGATPDPAYERMLRMEASRLGVAGRVRFAGLLDEAALIAEFARAQALILPSHQETAPMVVQQAMAGGLPVIATRVGGIPHQIADGRTGLLFNSGDATRLGGHLARIVAEPGLGEELGQAAKRDALKHYRADVVASATASVYRDMLRSATRQAA